MKKLILLILPLLVAVKSSSQSFTVTPKTGSFTETSNEEEIFVYATLTNNATENKTVSDTIFTWIRTLNMPEGWNCSICDPLACHLPFIDSSDFDLKAGKGGVFDANFYTYGIAGKGTAELFIYRKNKRNEGKKITFTALNGTTGTNEFVQIYSMTSFPNPATDNINVSISLAQSSDVVIELFDFSGRKLEVIHAGKNNSFEKDINLYGYKKGMYVLRYIINNTVVRNEKININ